MELSIPQMSMEEYVELQRQFGVRVIHRAGCHWRRVRPFFYRPILPVEAYAAARGQRPFGWPICHQYVVAKVEDANCTMNFIMLDALQEYSLAGLSHRRRHLITQAARRFQVRPIHDVRELKEQGHRVYLSFFQRTGYSYKSDRQQKAAFEKWAATLFRNPKVLVLGGYGPDGLVAVSVSCWVNTTLVYVSLFCETEALKKNLGEVMFHGLRQRAAQQPGINQVYVRNYQGGNSLDQYYLLRGCKLVRKPARLEMPSPVQMVIKAFMPRQHALLCGDK